MILGLYFYLYNITTISFSFSYHGVLIISNKQSEYNYNTIDINKHFIFHRLLNFKRFLWSKKNKKFEFENSLAGIYDVVKFLNDDILYNNSYKNNNFKFYLNIIEQQKNVGEKGLTIIVNNKNSGIFQTNFKNKAKIIHQQYYHYTPSDCGIISNNTFT